MEIGRKHGIAIILVVGYLLFTNLVFINQSFAENPDDVNQTNTTSQEIVDSNGTTSQQMLEEIPLVINITKNSNATDTVIDLVVDQVNSSVVDTSALEQIAKDRIPLLIETLKNTNASNIVAEYVLNATKAGITKNIPIS
ncbi:MAG: hypothetical protein ACE5SW_00475 [Nitrososphaeraceae archaeon]